MNRRRTFLIVFVVLILILVIGIGALLLMQGGLGGSTTKTKTAVTPVNGVTESGPTPQVQTERVVVALQTIPRGMRIPPEAVETREWPIEDPSFPEDPIYNIEDVVGMVARVEIPMHRPISAAKIKVVFQGEGSELSLAIPNGKVAIAIPVYGLGTVANALRAGDRVDVLISFSAIDVDKNLQVKEPVRWTYDTAIAKVADPDNLGLVDPPPSNTIIKPDVSPDDQIPRLVTQYAVQNALVLKVGVWEKDAQLEVAKPSDVSATPTPAGISKVVEATPVPAQELSLADQLLSIQVVTLVVDPQDALVLKWIRESHTSIDLVIRSAIDEDLYSPEAVTLQYMIDRFHISFPSKLPHTLDPDFKYRLLIQKTDINYGVAPVAPAE